MFVNKLIDYLYVCCNCGIIWLCRHNNDVDINLTIIIKKLCKENFVVYYFTFAIRHGRFYKPAMTGAQLCMLTNYIYREKNIVSHWQVKETKIYKLFKKNGKVKLLYTLFINSFKSSYEIKNLINLKKYVKNINNFKILINSNSNSNSKIFDARFFIL